MKYLNLHTHQYSGNQDVLEIINQYPNEFSSKFPFYSIGIHPWYIPENSEDYLKIIEEKLINENCLAIGECGLDKRIETDLSVQIQVFEKQLLLAEKYKKPVILHLVAAFQELIEIKKRLNISVTMVVHGFSGSKELANQLINNGFYLSFGKYLLLNPSLEESFLTVPEDRFFLETDTYDAKIEAVYDLASKYKNVPLQKLQQLIEINFNTVFRNGRMD